MVGSGRHRLAIGRLLGNRPHRSDNTVLSPFDIGR